MPWQPAGFPDPNQPLTLKSSSGSGSAASSSTPLGHRQADRTVVARRGRRLAGACTSAHVPLPARGDPARRRPARVAGRRRAATHSTCCSSTTRTTSRRATSPGRAAQRPGRLRLPRRPRPALADPAPDGVAPTAGRAPGRAKRPRHPVKSLGLHRDPAGVNVQPRPRPSPPTPRSGRRAAARTGGGSDRIAVPHEPLVAAARADPGDCSWRSSTRPDRSSAGRAPAGRCAGSCRQKRPHARPAPGSRAVRAAQDR